MKKIYLISAFALTASTMMAGVLPLQGRKLNSNPSNLTNKIEFTPTAAQPNQAPALNAAGETLSLEYGYCGEPASAFPLNDGEIGMAFELSAANTTLYAGISITSIIVPNCLDLTKSNPQQYIYVNSIETAEVFLTYDLNAEPFLTTTGKLGTSGFAWSTIDLDTPYEIEADKKVYVGVKYKGLTSNDIALIVDQYEATSGSCWVWSKFQGVSQSGYPVLQDDLAWKDLSQVLGCNVCVRAVISGENLPTNRVSIEDFVVPVTIAPNQEFPLTVLYKNNAANLVNSVDITMEIEGQEPQTVNFEGMNGNVAFNGYDQASGAFTCTKEGNNIPFTAYITKVNGEDIEADATNKISGYLLCMTEGFQRVLYVEELTGTKCPYCPRGYVGMENMRQRYTDKGLFAGVAVHANVNGADPMNVCSSGMPFADFANYGLGAPSAIAFRDFSQVLDPSADELFQVFQAYYYYPAVVAVQPEITVEDEKATLKVKSTFALSEENADYGIAYTITEDEVGPYAQTNGYAGSGYECGGFENWPSTVMLKFYDVARKGSVYSPIANSIPTTLVKDDTYEFSTELDLSGVSDLSKYAVTAMVMNRKTGKVENVGRVYSPSYTGVSKVVAEKDEAPLAFGFEGRIGIVDSADIYTIDGRKIASQATGTIEVPAGLYIARNAKGSVKVLVR